MTKVLYEIFCGTKSFSKVAEKNGYECVSLDIESKFNPTICIDFEEFDYKTIKKMIYWLMYNVNPKITYTIENPRARMRWFITEFQRKSVCYCKYGHQNMKPTDIWTNIDFPAKFCKNNNPDCNHVRAPRGSKTGTQGIPREQRYIIPPLLITEILENRNE